jgi:hypothetical protein
MAQKSGFFNARLVNGEYDRKYSANDYTDNLAVIIGNGVLRSTNDDLKVTASGMLVTVGIGRAWINGHYYFNTSAMTLASVPAAVGGSRYDRVVLRLNLNLNDRAISIVYLEGTASNNPVKPALTRNDTIYDICLADIYVPSSQNYVVAYDTRSDADVCGWVYSVSGDESFFTSLDNSFETWFENVRNTLASVSIIKRYTQIITLQSASNTVTFDIPQYNSDSCYVEAFVNGFYESRYTLSNSTLTFTNTLDAGTVVTINVYKSIDGTGIDTIVDDVTDLQNAVASLDGTSMFTYKLTGTDDNIALSEIAQAFLNGEYDSSTVSTAAANFLAKFNSSFWESLNNDAHITIRVEGQNLTATTPFDGSGTAVSRYRWFSFGQTGSTERQITFDFAGCENISIVPASGTSNIIFYGTDIHVKNAFVSVFTATSDINVDMIASSYHTGYITFDNCEFSVLTTGNVTLAQNGTFTNCKATLRSSAGNCYGFCPKTNALIRVIGGTYYTYIKASGKLASVIYVASTETNAVVMAYNISAPTTALSGFSQAYLSSAYAGNVYINGVVSTQTTQGSNTEIVGQIWKSKF